jgi:hypothetical protein
LEKRDKRKKIGEKAKNKLKRESRENREIRSHSAYPARKIPYTLLLYLPLFIGRGSKPPLASP